MSAALVAAGAAAGAVACAATAWRSWSVAEPFRVALSARPEPAGVAAPARSTRRERKRRDAARTDEVPQFLDLLAAGSTAGLSAEVSFRRAGGCLRGPLGADLDEVMRSVDLGVPWREAIDAYVERAGDVDLSRMSAVLARTESLGVSLRDATRELSMSVREARRASTLERARTAPVRMLFPLVFLILPAFLLLTVVPVLITTVRSIN